MGPVSESTSPTAVTFSGTEGGVEFHGNVGASAAAATTASNARDRARWTVNVPENQHVEFYAYPGSANPSHNLAELIVANGAIATVHKTDPGLAQGAGSQVLVVNDLNIASTGKLDLTNNSMVLRSNETDLTADAAMIRSKIISARGVTGLGATWTGYGLTSSTAALVVINNAEARSLGYAINGQMPLGSFQVFLGQVLDENSIVVRYTKTADVNLDLAVNDDDVTVVGAFYAPGFANGQWMNGDIDYNGFVDDDDVTLLGAFYEGP